VFIERLLPTALFSGGEKVPEADEGALALAEQWTICMNGLRKLIETLNFSASTAPSSAFGTFSPRKKTAEGEGRSTGYRVPTIPVRVCSRSQGCKTSISGPASGFTVIAE
jgi:hypothetical protein